MGASVGNHLRSTKSRKPMGEAVAVSKSPRPAREESGVMELVGHGRPWYPGSPVSVIATLVMDGPKLCCNATSSKTGHTWVARAQLGLQRIHFAS